MDLKIATNLCHMTKVKAISSSKWYLLRRILCRGTLNIWNWILSQLSLHITSTHLKKPTGRTKCWDTQWWVLWSKQLSLSQHLQPQNQCDVSLQNISSSCCNAFFSLFLASEVQCLHFWGCTRAGWFLYTEVCVSPPKKPWCESWKQAKYNEDRNGGGFRHIPAIMQGECLQLLAHWAPVDIYLCCCLPTREVPLSTHRPPKDSPLAPVVVSSGPCLTLQRVNSPAGTRGCRLSQPTRKV